MIAKGEIVRKNTLRRPYMLQEEENCVKNTIFVLNRLFSNSPVSWVCSQTF